jgi:hypothetical protein
VASIQQYGMLLVLDVIVRAIAVLKILFDLSAKFK